MPESGKIYVIKKNGGREEFSEKKVLRAMARVGLPEGLRTQVLDHIKARLHQDIETSEIYSHLQEFLKDKDHKAAIKLNLKDAIFELGPTGFPFERYIQRIFKNMGYKANVNLNMRGSCVTHEIDLLVEKDGKREIIEAKFHNQQGIITDVQVLLYTMSRFLDVKENNSISGVWVVTNTKLSIDAAQYAMCKGIKVIGWNYPEQNNLQDFVERPSMYPITILRVLNRSERQSLINANVILCSDLLKIKEHDLVTKYFLDKDSAAASLKQAEILVGG